MPELSPAVARLIELALEEDLGRGDVTTAAVIGADVSGEADIIAREPLVVAGIAVTEAVFRRVDRALDVTRAVADGARVDENARVLSVFGPAASILAAERTALNFLQRLSGVATSTRAYVEAVRGTTLRICDTRKTTPGFRLLEKEAVRAGGGSNHRFDLGSGVLIKDNHIAIAGSIGKAIEGARRTAPHGLQIEVEVDTIRQLDEALEGDADIILLDNFSDARIEEAMSHVRQYEPQPLIEISGGVTLDRLRGLADAGVDIVSVGALTHSARAVDLSLELRCRTS